MEPCIQVVAAKIDLHHFLVPRQAETSKVLTRPHFWYQSKLKNSAFLAFCDLLKAAWLLRTQRVFESLGQNAVSIDYTPAAIQSICFARLPATQTSARSDILPAAGR